jgi:hypothetical protein
MHDGAGAHEREVDDAEQACRADAGVAAGCWS